MGIFACPVCGATLRREETAYRCPQGHSYDLAKEGYVYLLPPNRKHSADPGDSREMVAARRRFLEAGHYAPFSDCLNRLAEDSLPQGRPVILDAGCGEGYYAGRLREHLLKRGAAPEQYGLDISKSAVRAAAKKYRGIMFAVGSIFGIPALSASADVLTDVFAPIVPREYARVLRPGGVLILAVPSQRHLYGLKEILYDEPYENEYRETEYPGFAFLRRVPVRGNITLNGAREIGDLFAMTPYFRKTPREGCERLARTQMLRTEIGFDFLLYRKVGE
ncbi:23S rRNA (guanine(745)-N(1))-methyltransferase [Caprobacter fermentans]|uniref:23S rRNA (Guanine(745)-N(1))-methyltransferase n=1 Tax=Caproicibacter fermentans TaxID=2576756 RepID=A0A6N8I3A3_9FIRM|nr:methyltransferase domain-containing protein [Caproicibacter fermentans]MVB12217.1 23S rRNA (guanine(745)-N(1))-methyltransferase [Caproicibacter fermentans]QNK39654.1 methyltransferase domain-containing protein [Caproicibacter fermentans]